MIDMVNVNDSFNRVRNEYSLKDLEGFENDEYLVAVKDSAGHLHRGRIYRRTEHGISMIATNKFSDIDDEKHWYIPAVMRFIPYQNIRYIDFLADKTEVEEVGEVMSQYILPEVYKKLEKGD